MPPLATYRVQLHAGFTFDDVAGLAGYLADLGVTHAYCSPYLQSVPGSLHGYDVVDHHRLDADRGGEEGFARMVAALAAHGLSHVADIVPNHMAAHPRSNAWLWDVLENGPSSRWALFFDIDWNPPDERLRERVLLPVLGDHYGRVLEAGGITVERDGGSFLVRAGEVVVPVSPRTLDDLLAQAATASGSDELASIAVALGRLPPASATDEASVEERHRDKEVLRAALARLLEEDPRLAEDVDCAVADLNASPDALDELLQRQNYRLAHWKVAGQELDYRRFFDVADLVALRTEDPRVFAATHELILALVAEGAVAGLRIDHPDGLRDPHGYFARLSQRARPGVWIVAEKILSGGEELPAGWAAAGLAGTTGYEFLNLVTGLFVDPAAEGALTKLYAELTGEPAEFGTVAAECKDLVLRQTLAADVNRITNLLLVVGERHRRARDFTRRDLYQAVREVAASLDVYRTYVRPGADPDPADVARLEAAAAAAAERRPDVDPDVFPFLLDVLALRLPSDTVAAEVAMRFQQLTGPVMAKGVEDTAFYRYHRLVALNEVGGEPGRFGRGVDEFHAHNSMVARSWPASMLTTSTHDTKRSEDVRARLVLLSEIPDRWAEAVRRWAAANERHRSPGGAPDRNLEYLVYQTLVGAWPIGVDRLLAYVEKAAKEAKQHTSWTDPDPGYEAAVRSFVEGVMADDAFLADLAGFVAPLVRATRVTSLAQTLLKLTAPGVPDVYQGCELWDHSLVDPDNRRPVDYELRRRALAAVRDVGPEEAWGRFAEEGGVKLWLIRRALAVRARRAAAFGGEGGYQPLAASGPQAERVVAYARGGPDVVVLVPRLALGLEAAGGWGGTVLALPPGRWRDALGNGPVVEGPVAKGPVVEGPVVEGPVVEGPVAVADLLARFPVALLERD
jgi:(1->4)-alpha-D-glucan 1-alpha-D-glucosylmutase